MEHAPPRDTQIPFDMLFITMFYTCLVTGVVYHRGGGGAASYKKNFITLYSIIKKYHERHKKNSLEKICYTYTVMIHLSGHVCSRSIFPDKRVFRITESPISLDVELFVRTCEISGLSEPGLTNNHCTTLIPTNMMFSLLNKCIILFKLVTWTNDKNTGEGCTLYLYMSLCAWIKW